MADESRVNVARFAAHHHHLGTDIVAEMDMRRGQHVGVVLVLKFMKLARKVPFVVVVNQGQGRNPRWFRRRSLRS